MKWHDYVSVKKGDIGERIIREMFEKIGYIIYQPITAAPHAVDFFAVKKKQKIVAIEVKTKPRLKYYPATGFNIKSFREYQKFQELYPRIKVFLLFVDEVLGQVYGNYLEKLAAKTVIDDNIYPKEINDVIIFPLKNMEVFRKLTQEEIANIRSYTRSNYLP